jgi:16S rRNA (uracil1498-N3)-methyltransferase
VAARFFVEGVRSIGDVVTFDGGDARKIVLVLRLRSGDRVEVIDSGASAFLALLDVDGRNVSARLESSLPPDESSGALRVTVAQGVPKGAKMDFVVEKLTELGADEIVPLISERAVADAGPAKVERWRRLAKTAAMQCGRRDVPRLADPATLDALLLRVGEFDCAVLAWELADREPLRVSLPRLLEGAGTMLIIIGPEGGFSHDEAAAATAAGAVPVWLGRRILRTETAGLALLAAINVLVET